MRRVSRRQFAKMVGGAALAAPLALNARGEPLAPSLGWPQEPKPAPQKAPETQPPAEAPKPEPRLKLSKEQEERVKQAVERRERQLAALRGRALAYDAEPAFVFQVRQRPRSGRRM